ncbi:MAG: VWA domain-containing protein [Acidobacteriota bacterium]|nr:VWA domain-containing protein [Acidobacteriota bacterium]
MHRSARIGLVACAAVVLVCSNLPQAAAQTSGTSIRITSPLGRTGVPGVVRVVAQVVTPAPGGVVPVRFFVDGNLLGEDVDGPPYLTEWVDENPYEPRVIRAEVGDGLGGVVADQVSLDALEVIEEAQVSSVLVEATVTDERGRYVQGLVRAHFDLFEDENQQRLDLVQGEVLPTTFTLLVDGSQSMSRRIDLVRATASRLASKLRLGDMVVVAPFRRGIEAATGPTNDAQTIADAIAGIAAKGGTAILDSLAELPDYLARAEGRQVVILVTDGYDEHSQTDVETAFRALQRLHATVYVVGIGGVAGISLKGESLLRRIAVQMGGRAFFPTRQEQLPDVHGLIATDAYSRYVITYTPTNQEMDGAYRRIRLVVRVPDYSVKARPGYYAPAPPPVRPTIEFSAGGDSDATIALSASDLVVIEDGAPQTIESFQEANAPMSIVMALDGSGSMRQALDAVKAAATSFVNALRPADPLALVHFSDRVVVEHELSTRRQLTLDAIASHQALGGTALWDALFDSMAYLKRQPGRRAVVVLTDGRDEDNPGTAPGSAHTLADVLAQVRDTETTVYAIGLGPRVDREALDRVAAVSGGAAYFPEDVSQLADRYRRVVDDLRRRYIITYTSTNGHRDGSWRTVDISTPRGDLVIRSVGGYWAPGRATAPAPGQE